MPAGRPVSRVTFYSPDESTGETVPFENQEGMVSFTVPSFKVYGLAELSA
jgi:hypothetical protein